MGTGNVLPTLVILIVAVMMVFSLIPIASVSALHSGDGAHCPGEPKSPWKHIGTTIGGVGDSNNNGFVCEHEKNGNIRDDLCRTCPG